jgi:AraC-like DNA-binding protein
MAPVGRGGPGTLDCLLLELAGRHGLPQTEIAGPSKRFVAVTARAEFCARAHAEHGWTLAAIARYLGISRPSVARALRRQSAAPDSASRSRRTA